MRQLLLFLGLPIILIVISECHALSLAPKSSPNRPDETEETNIDPPQHGQSSRHKRFALTAAISILTKAVGFLGPLEKLLGGDSDQTSKQLEEIQSKLRVLDDKIDGISRDIEKLHVTTLYGKQVRRLRFLLSTFTHFIKPKNETWAADKEAQSWADQVIDLDDDGVAQILHDFHDMVIGKTDLFASRPVLLVFEGPLSSLSDSYPNEVKEIIDFLYSIQVSGYAVWMSALNIKGMRTSVASVQQLAKERFTIQTRLMYKLLTGWPAGSYGLPMPDTGCPEKTDMGVKWETGYRYHDTENDNEWSRNLRFPAGSFDKSFIEQHFCMMNNNASMNRWPEGEYCIFKSGDCPHGFENGSIVWDDEDTHNANDVYGSVPDGRYNYYFWSGGTSIDYCCRSDGSVSTPIDLPLGSPFYLIRYKSTCQQVTNMEVSTHFLWWDDENRDFNGNHVMGSHPDTGSDKRNHKIHYCYYY